MSARIANLRRSCGALLLVLGTALWASIGVCGLYARSCRAVRPPGLGNFEDTVRRLSPAPEGSFRFAAMGDPEEGLGVYCDLARKARELGAAFVVVLGDVASQGTPAAFELFNHAHASLGPAALPTFLAKGNHDESPLGLFEKYWGPGSFDFVHAGCLFIFAENNTPEEQARCAEYIRARVEEHRGRVHRIFLLLHRPITDFEKAGHGKRNIEARSRYLYDILDHERIDAVLAGHFHGYSRALHDETLLLVTGCAGGKLDGPGEFYHMVLLDVTPEGIVETVVRAEATRSFLDDLRHGIVVRLGPWLFASWHRAGLAMMLGAVFLALGVHLMRRRVGGTGRGRSTREAAADTPLGSRVLPVKGG